MAGGELAGADSDLRGKPCPMCGHVRSAADTSPAWQCPKCGIAYVKFPPRAARLGTRLAAGGRELALEASEDRSALVLIAANLAALAIAWRAGMSLRELMMVYWIQSVIIGICSFVRILSLERFDPSNLNIGKRPVQETTGDKLKVACFFLLHYGFFHFGYLIFVLSERSHDSRASAGGYLLCALVFALNHGYSLLKNVALDARGRPSIGTLMFLPYARVFPMHLTILFGGTFFAGAFALFGGLKILADVAMHTLEHHVLRASKEAS
jgi:ribosomal protein S27AE